MADGNIFISYRRGPDSNAAGRLFERLERSFRGEQLFFDIDSIPLGVDFAEFVDEQVARCDVLLVVIGPAWLDATKRLQDPEDLVRLEIEAALRRPNIPVIPVLFEGAEMPHRNTLPDSLQPLVRRNAIMVTHEQFTSIVDGRLTDALKEAIAQGHATLGGSDGASLVPPRSHHLDIGTETSSSDAKPGELSKQTERSATQQKPIETSKPNPAKVEDAEKQAPAGGEGRTGKRPTHGANRMGVSGSPTDGESRISWLVFAAGAVFVALIALVALSDRLIEATSSPSKTLQLLGQATCITENDDINYRVEDAHTRSLCLDACRRDGSCNGTSMYTWNSILLMGQSPDEFTDCIVHQVPIVKAGVRSPGAKAECWAYR